MGVFNEKDKKRLVELFGSDGDVICDLADKLMGHDCDDSNRNTIFKAVPCSGQLCKLSQSTDAGQTWGDVEGCLFPMSIDDVKDVLASFYGLSDNDEPVDKNDDLIFTYDSVKESLEDDYYNKCIDDACGEESDDCNDCDYGSAEDINYSKLEKNYGKRSIASNGDSVVITFYNGTDFSSDEDDCDECDRDCDYKHEEIDDCDECNCNPPLFSPQSVSKGSFFFNDEEGESYDCDDCDECVTWVDNYNAMCKELEDIGVKILLKIEGEYGKKSLNGDEAPSIFEKYLG